MLTEMADGVGLAGGVQEALSPSSAPVEEGALIQGRGVKEEGGGKLQETNKTHLLHSYPSP